MHFCRCGSLATVTVAFSRLVDFIVCLCVWFNIDSPKVLLSIRGYDFIFRFFALVPGNSWQLLQKHCPQRSWRKAQLISSLPNHISGYSVVSQAFFQADINLK